jgi:hypothetical protein
MSYKDVARKSQDTFFNNLLRVSRTPNKTLPGSVTTLLAGQQTRQ